MANIGEPSRQWEIEEPDEHPAIGEPVPEPVVVPEREPVPA